MKMSDNKQALQVAALKNGTVIDSALPPCVVKLMMVRLQ